MTGPVLFTPDYSSEGVRYLPRKFATHLVVNWAAQFVVSCGPELVLQETVYGGYQAHIMLRSWFLPSTSKTLDIQDAFDTFYVTAPGSSTPISAGVCGIGWTYDQHYMYLPFIGVRMQGYDLHTYSYLPLATVNSPWDTPWPTYPLTCHTAYYP